MAVGVKVTVVGLDKVERLLKQLRPPASDKAITAGLFRSAEAVKADSTLNQIIRGGKGPVDAKRLTSRSGDLRRSITIDRTKTPRSIQVGTHLKYGRAHELGFSGNVTVRAHRRKLKSGTFDVRSHTRNMKLKARPFLQPALDKVSPRFPTFFVEEIERRLPR